jgi:TonB dependent receptor/TonB-dependent Receptor Plug Domain
VFAVTTVYRGPTMPKRISFQLCLWLFAPFCPEAAWAQVQTLEKVEVTGTAVGLETAGSASEGEITRQQIQDRPAYRPGEVLEAMPGLIVTQHSGEGKANQYFLRGFNLDHGSDLAIMLDDMPVNMRTHGHGQGYSDLNFMIPELARGFSFHKGPYFADDGDFASAGSVRLGYVDRLDKDFAEVTGGMFGYARSVVATSTPAGAGNWLTAGELLHNDGPWNNADDYQKANGVVRYSEGSRDDGFSLTGMAYGGRWNATNQIARRALDSGLIDRWGSLDPTDGGDASRFSLSGRWAASEGDHVTAVSAYAIHSELELFNNFTYFLNDPTNGDQFRQLDDRNVYGVNASRTFYGTFGGRDMENVVGVQTRYDDIHVGLFNTAQRRLVSTVRDDRVNEASAGLYVQNTMRWTDWFRTTEGLRGDQFYGTVHSDTSANSGSDSDAIVSPKLGLVFGPWAKTEYYVNAGTGYHSNDLRGTTISVDPSDKTTPQRRVPLLVRSKGAEIGARTEAVPGLASTLSLFVLDFNSELLFQGDTGTTEASRPSRRVGVEFTNGYKLMPWLTVDFDVAYTRARFSDQNPVGDRIPGAVEGVVGTGVEVDNLGAWFGGLRLRYFGPRPLIEDDSVRSSSTTLVSGRVGYKLTDALRARLDVFNLLNTKASQIDYYYASRLPGEPTAGVNDVHFHPVEPLTLRLSLSTVF